MAFLSLSESLCAIPVCSAFRAVQAFAIVAASPQPRSVCAWALIFTLFTPEPRPSR
jgi:hypothetical protein